MRGERPHKKMAERQDWIIQ